MYTCSFFALYSCLFSPLPKESCTSTKEKPNYITKKTIVNCEPTAKQLKNTYQCIIKWFAEKSRKSAKLGWVKITPGFGSRPSCRVLWIATVNCSGSFKVSVQFWRCVQSSGYNASQLHHAQSYSKILFEFSGNELLNFSQSLNWLRKTIFLSSGITRFYITYSSR